jgi:Polyketide cyclase / dehydrase and lipid transport
MNALKAILFGAAGLFLVITLLSLLITANPRVARMVVINTASKEKVMAQLTDLANWKNWHPVLKSDSVSVSYGKITSGPGASCDITYNGKTTHVAITAVDTASVSVELTATGESDISNQVVVTYIPSMNQVKADWIATTHLHWYPWEKFYAIFIDKLTGPGYEAALQGLKTYIEK